MADNSYQLETKIAAKSGWDTPSQAKARYGRYSRDGITVHWWNTPENIPKNSASHDNIVNYILGKATRGIGSVNYVLSDYKISVLVYPDNVAWASQSGNPTTVSIEFDPHLSGEGYKKAGWLIDQLEQRYGKTLTLYQHKHWFSTACPGTLDINRMRAEADKWKRGEYDKPVAPKITYRRIEKRVWITRLQPTHLWNLDFTSIANAISAKPFDKGEKVEIVGVADHPTGEQYFMTASSFGNADQTGIPAHNRGFNKKDMEQEPDVVPVTPPVVVPPVVMPPLPTEHDMAQDAEINLIKGTLNSLVALLREFAQSILNKFKG